MPAADCLLHVQVPWAEAGVDVLLVARDGTVRADQATLAAGSAWLYRSLDLWPDRAYCVTMFRLFMDQDWAVLRAVGLSATLHFPDYSLVAVKALVSLLCTGKAVLPCTTDLDMNRCVCKLILTREPPRPGSLI